MARAADPIQARSAALRIVSTLRDAGHIAYFAGGCVRDELLDLAPTDYDVATDATPDRVAALFDRAMLVGAAFGVVLVPLQGATVEVATFRSDGPYSDARRPDVIHFSDPVADARRRDFTINALFLDPLAPPDPGFQPSPRRPRPPRGRILDYVGGVADLDAGIVRAVGDPEQRLAEDHLRALRAVRFAARLSFQLDPATAQAITRHAAELRGVSRERIGEEVRRMLLHPSRAAAAELLQQLGLDAPVLDGPHLTVPLTTLRGLGTDPVPYPTCLAAWILDRSPDPTHLAAPPARSRRARSHTEGVVGQWRIALKLSNDERDQLARTLAIYERLRTDWLTSDQPTQKRVAGSPVFDEAVRILKVREPGIADQVMRRVAELAATPGGIAPDPLLTGDDLVQMGDELGIKPGPRFKEILDAVYDAQLEGRVQSKSQARELARHLCV